MKKLAKILGIILTCLALAAGGLYIFLIRPGQVFIEEHKKDMVAKADNFMKCMMEGQAEVCSNDFLSENFKNASPPEKMKMLSDRLKKTLVERINSIPYDESFAWKKFAGPKGVTTSVNFRMKVNFVGEANASEEYTFVKSGDGPFLIEAFRINANKLLQ